MSQRISDEDLKKVTGGKGEWNGHWCSLCESDGEFFDHYDYKCNTGCTHWESKNGNDDNDHHYCDYCKHLDT